MTVLAPSVIMSLSWQVFWYTTAGFITINAAWWLQKTWPERDKTKPAVSSPFIYSHLKGGFVHNRFPLIEELKNHVPQQGPDVCGSRNKRQSRAPPMEISAPPNPTRRNWHPRKQRALTRPAQFPQWTNTEMRQPACSAGESALRVQMSGRNGEERVLVSKTGKAEPKFRSITLFLRRK